MVAGIDKVVKHLFFAQCRERRKKMDLIILFTSTHKPETQNFLDIGLRKPKS